MRRIAAIGFLLGVLVAALIVHLVPMLIDRGIPAAQAAGVAAFIGVAVTSATVLIYGVGLESKVFLAAFADAGATDTGGGVGAGSGCGAGAGVADSAVEPGAAPASGVVMDAPGEPDGSDASGVAASGAAVGATTSAAQKNDACMIMDSAKGCAPRTVMSIVEDPAGDAGGPRGPTGPHRGALHTTMLISLPGT